MLPLDLHVLSLSLAFILSQDQTLRCNYILFRFFRFSQDISDLQKLLTVGLSQARSLSLVLLYYPFTISKIVFLVLAFSTPSLSCDFLVESGCKSTASFYTLQIFSQLFFEKILKLSATRCLSPTSSLLQYLSSLGCLSRPPPFAFLTERAAKILPFTLSLQIF